MGDSLPELSNKWILKLDEKGDKLLNAKKINKFCSMYDISNLFLSHYDYDDFFLPPLEDDKEVSPMPALAGDEKEVKEEKWIRISAPNKLSTRLPILFAHIKARNNSYKLKNEIRKIVYIPYKHNKITRKLYNYLIKSS